MKSNDLIQNKSDILQAMRKALKDNDAAAYSQAMDNLIQHVADTTRQEFHALQVEQDARIMANRGTRQLTSAEQKFYTSFGEAIQSDYPSQALTDAKLTLPETVVNSVFEEISTEHPLLSKIDFLPVNGSAKLLMSKSARQCAVWGDLCDKVTKEITSSFVEIDSAPFKLTAFLPVCKSILTLGPAWLDRFVRGVLYEQLACGLENAIISGTGNKQPIGMDRNVGSDASVTGGNYPQKDAEAITDLSPKTVGALVAKLAKDESGKDRKVSGLILVVNPQDYYKLIMPATTLMSPSGQYQRDILPVPADIIPCEAVTAGEAIFGMAKRYFATAGTSAGGKIEYSDHAQFLDDNRVYMIKYHGNGRPKDNNAFLRLNISGLKPLSWAVTAATTGGVGV